MNLLDFLYCCKRKSDQNLNVTKLSLKDEAKLINKIDRIRLNSYSIEKEDNSSSIISNMINKNITENNNYNNFEEDLNYNQILSYAKSKYDRKNFPLIPKESYIKLHK